MTKRMTKRQQAAHEREMDALAVRLFLQGKLGVRAIQKRTGVPSWMIQGLAIGAAIEQADIWGRRGR